MKFRFLFALLFMVCFNEARSQKITYEEKKGIVYTHADDAYSKEKCQLDIYYPTEKKDFTTVIWFHGGSLTGGGKDIPIELKSRGVAVISVGYRLSPRAKVEDIILDARDAVQWAYEHIEQYGGNKQKIVLSGHSAGAYLALMITLNKSYLQAVGVDVDSFMGIVPFSGQTITHFTVRKERNIPDTTPVVDSLAPLYWVRKDALPILLITGDRELEMLGRYEENAYLMRMLKVSGHQHVALYELDGYDHGMTYPAFPLLFKQIEKWERDN